MSNPSEHPPRQELVDFGLGKLGPDQTTQIEEHLDHCDECHDTLLNLADDTFTGLVRSLPEPIEESQPESPDSESPHDTEPGDSPTEELTDGAVTDNESSHAATMLVQSGDSIEPSELPEELQNHTRYRIVELIGKGGMGDVYRAEHKLMNRSVALKLINSQLVKHPQAVERFRREVQAAAQLTHPNIVTAFDAEQAGDVHFLVMEFVDGTDLASVIQHRGALPVNEACDCVLLAAKGLQHAHEKGMVHRDIKPHNLMLSPDGQVRILDFGLAGFATESALLEADSAGGTDGDTTPLHLTAFGSVMGTPDYIAPEQAQDAHTADIRADIYSLGCTLCYLLTGDSPFKADSVVDKLKAHVEQEPPRLDELRDDVPSELADVMIRMMAKDPADPFQSPEAVAEALAPFITFASQTIEPAPVQTRPRRFLRSPVAWLCTLLLAGVIYVITNQGRIEIRSDVDVAVTVSKNGQQVEVFDVESGTSVFWLPTGDYRVAPKGDVAVTISRKSVAITRLGRESIRIQSVDTPGMKEKALAALQPWLALLDGEKYGECWDNMAPFARHETTRDRFIKANQLIPDRMGSAVDRHLESQRYANSLARVGDGHFVTFRFNTHFERQKNMREQAVLQQQSDGAWKVIDYFATLPSKSRPENVSPSQTGLAEQTDYDRLQGTWVCRDGFMGNKPLPKDHVLGMTMTFDHDVIKIRSPGSPLMKMKYAIAQNRDPKWIEFINPDKTSSERAIAGIYSIDGDDFRIAFDDADRPRPRNFEPSDGRDHFVGTFQRMPNKTGILTNPRSVPPGGLPIRKNLIADPSLEDTRTGELPRSWSAWLDDGPDFKCEVVEGGMTGKHCLQISGNGTRGVVFCTSIPMDRTKRYVLKGRVRLEGDDTTWAVIKINYFNKSGWLGVDDRAGVTAQSGWQLLEKTDRADAFPKATLMVPTCHIEGNGTAWFDDLELIAYERDKLPADFDKTHGKNNKRDWDQE